MKKLKKLKLHEFAAMDEKEMKSIVGGYGNSNEKKVCAYIKCSCSQGLSLGAPQSVSSSWTIACDKSPLNEIPYMEKICAFGEGNCHVVYKDSPYG